MKHSPIRLFVFCLIGFPSLGSPLLLAADSEPVVIKPAPETDEEAMREELAEARAENRRLAAELNDAKTKLASAQSALDLLTTKNQQLETDLGAAVVRVRDAEKREAATRRQLAAAKAAPPAAPAPAPDLSAKLAETEDKLATTLRSFSQLQTENDRLKAAATDTAKLQEELNHLRDEKTALEAKLNAPPAPDLSARLAETEDKLATTLRSFSQLQAENDRLKAGAADTAKLNDELESLRAEKATFESRLAEAKTPAAPPADDARVAAAESKLETALRAYSQLQAENERLKTEAANNAANAQATAAKSATESATQLSALFDELRQTKSQVAALSAENAELKTKLALAGPSPGSRLASPSRPGAAIANPPSPAIPAEASTDAPRQHIVAPGDTLAKISRQYYGTPNRWDEIQRANPDVIKNENTLPIGATLQIP